MLVLVLVTAIATTSLPVRSAPETTSPTRIEEYQLKAAFLERFLGFVHWPSSSPNSQSTSPRLLGVVGRNPFASRPGVGNEATADPFRLLKLVECRSVEDAARCHIVFFTEADEPIARAILKGLETLPVLTVGEGPEFTRRGGMIGMIPVDRRVRLEINADQARLSGLRLDPQLLKLATLTKPARP